MIEAFFKAAFDLVRPKIIFFVFGLPILATLLWVGIGFFSFDFFHHLFLQAASRWEFSADWGTAVIALLMFLLGLPLIYWTALGLMAVFALPVILKILKPQYPGLPSQGLSLHSSLRLMFKIVLVLIPIYCLLLFLFWVPFVFIGGTFVLGAWVNSYFLSLEILSEYCDQATIQSSMKKYQVQTWAMGAALMFLLSIPVFGLLTPVFGGLWFSHFWLAKISSRATS